MHISLASATLMNMTRAEMVSSAFLFSTMTAILKNLWEFARQSLPPSAQWSTDDMPDLAGRVVLVTGPFLAVFRVHSPDWDNRR